MLDELFLGHEDGVPHPAQEPQVGLVVQVDVVREGESLVPSRLPGRLADAFDVPLGVEDARILGLQSQHGECQQKQEAAEQIDERRGRYVREGGHLGPPSAAHCQRCDIFDQLTQQSSLSDSYDDLPRLKRSWLHLHLHLHLRDHSHQNTEPRIGELL